MKTVVKKINIYKYSELSEKAKEKVRWDYVYDPAYRQDFTNMIDEDLKNLFPNSKLKSQWELFCQGGGVNVYGDLDVMDLVNMVKNDLCGDTYLDFKNYFSPKEMKTLKFYSDFCRDVYLPCNRYYTYCVVESIDLEADWENKLANNYFRNINFDLIEKLQKYVIDIFKKYCKNWEDVGYDYFDPDKLEDMEEICDCNDWWFLDDGTFYAALIKRQLRSK